MNGGNKRMERVKKNLQRRNRRSRFLKRGVYVLVIALLLGGASQAFAADIQIVCNENIPVDSLTKKELRDIFLGKTIEWENEEKVTLAIVKDKALHKTFLKEYISMTPSKFRTYWKQMIFTGKSSSSPKPLKTEDDLVKFVAETEGAIGYVSSEIQADEVKILTISD